MLKALLTAAACMFALSGAIAPVLAQDIEPFVIVPDGPAGGPDFGGGGGFRPGGGGGGGNAVTTSGLNVRSGPGTRYAVIDVLSSGASVRIDSCSGGWCWINHRGPSGWVSENHLRRTGGGGGNAVRPRREACFYEEPRFRGRSFCAVPGESDRSLGSWNNRIASISIRGFPTVQVCTGRDFNGCDAFNEDTAHLPRWLEWNISSFRVFH